MRIDFVTLFPDMVLQALDHSILARAQASAAVAFGVVNPRDFTHDRHRTVDDEPYGGGPGMVMMAPPIAAALDSLAPEPGTPVVLTDPAGAPFRQSDAAALSRHPRVVFICGHYEGVDERVRTMLANHAYSIGDFVLTGGELAALAMADAVVRLLPGVLGDPESHRDDSYSSGGLLGHPLYTRPLEFRGERVPEVLVSGHHGRIAAWRRSQSVRRTRRERPDLFATADLSWEDLCEL